MALKWIVVLVALLTVAMPATGKEGFEMDTIKTSGGDLTITFIGHGTLMFGYGGRTIHVDPWSKLADYAALPQADLILITHEHGDHLDPAAIQTLRTPDTVVIANPAAAEQVPGSIAMGNGDRRSACGLDVQAVPAYNRVHMRSAGVPYHPRGAGNGYVITFGDTRVYVAGDTENIPEMQDLTDIHCAFLPMNLPYTMNPEMVADAARAIQPEVLYPYHFGDTDTTLLEPLLAGSGIEVRIRDMH